jgi:hypothetical protein
MNLDLPNEITDRRISARLILFVPDHGLRSNPRICFASRAGKPIRTFLPKPQSTVKTSITKPISQMQTPETARNEEIDTRLLEIL